MRSLDWKTILKGFAAYWALLAPVFLVSRLAQPGLPADVAVWLPCGAAFLVGLLCGYVSPAHRVGDCVVLGVAMATSHLLVDSQPTAGDAIDSIAVSVFLVLAGSSLGDHLLDKAKRARRLRVPEAAPDAEKSAANRFWPISAVIGAFPGHPLVKPIELPVARCARHAIAAMPSSAGGSTMPSYSGLHSATAGRPSLGGAPWQQARRRARTAVVPPGSLPKAEPAMTTHDAHGCACP